MKRSIGVACLAAYIATIWLANYLVQHYGIVSIGLGLAAPAGVYAAGLAFTLRDLTQTLLGRTAVIAAILAGAAVSWFISPTLATASAAAFILSELADFAVYTPLERKRWLGAVVASNIVGACIDSTVFLWLAFHSLAFLKGQIVGKLEMTALAVLLLAAARQATLARRHA